ncbi:(ABC) transporter [Perkinsus chesapeaki]|uniref:(ABC) transporter n=1 Tax=Perkinsus chesapeaki TaxID=330153 RepID=A0A7J6LQ51_PERCH|nr:(ABC) transporter [Perkinsus chesapeaki]
MASSTSSNKADEWEGRCKVLMAENALEDKQRADMVLERYLTLIEQQFEGILSNIPETILSMRVSDVDPKSLKPISRILRTRYKPSTTAVENREPNRPADLPPRPQALGPAVSTPRKEENNNAGGGLVYSMKKLFGGGGGASSKTDPSPARALKPRVL